MNCLTINSNFMKTKILLMILTVLIMTGCKNKSDQNKPSAKSETFKISEETIKETARQLKEKYGETYEFRIDRGVQQVASLWSESDGKEEDFVNFCLENFEPDSAKLLTIFSKLERNFEVIFGLNNKMTLKLNEPLHLNMGEITFVDLAMGAYSPMAHFNEDMFANKIAFYVALNFPAYSLTEKEKFADSWTRIEWAYARMGDMFISRVPSELNQNYSEVATQSDAYIADYNIYMGNIVDDKFNTYFPKDMVLITHWGLRDELKANYNTENGLQKQKFIYDIMLRIIRQEIPVEVINKSEYKWNPSKNLVFDAQNKEVKFTAEPYTRYEYLLKNFKALSAMDKYNPVYPTYILRAYDQSMEITREEVEKIFIDFITAPEIAEVAKLIKKRLNRDLQPFDIWYDGFKLRSEINQDELTAITRRKYPDAQAFAKDIPRILLDLGWTRDKANYIAAKIAVDPARGAGHAWGAQMKGDQAHLRTRIGDKGMDYKGYNIAIHELGHNVEQTITLYDVDYYMLSGVPNTAFTEAIAFLFQGNDIKLLGRSNATEKQKVDALNALDNCWSAYEIMGVALVDMYVWQWMYENPDANPKELKEAVEKIAIDVWNKYYYPIFGVKDSPILAIYSHMITSPLYLANYPIGHLIEFQIAEYIKDKKFADEVTRMLVQGRITPQAWMKNAVGDKINGNATLAAVRDALKIIKD